MTSITSKHATFMQRVLNLYTLNCKVIELPSSTRTANQAAQAIGCHINQIIKSLIFKTKISQKAVLILVSGGNQVNLKKVEAHIGEVLIKADASFVKKVTGFSIGGIPPIGHKTSIESIYIDQDLLKTEIVWAAAGTSNAVFSISIQKLLKVLKGTILSLST